MNDGSKRKDNAETTSMAIEATCKRHKPSLQTPHSDKKKQSISTLSFRDEAQVIGNNKRHHPVTLVSTCTIHEAEEGKLTHAAQYGHSTSQSHGKTSKAPLPSQPS